MGLSRPFAKTDARRVSTAKFAESEVKPSVDCIKAHSHGFNRGWKDATKWMKKKYKKEIDRYIESIEITGNKELMEGIKQSLEDIKNGYYLTLQDLDAEDKEGEQK